MSREVYKDKYYTHFDKKKHHKDYEERVENISWVGKHGFYPFIHFSMNFNKYINDSEGNKSIKPKERDIFMRLILIGISMSIMEIDLIIDIMLI